MSLHENTSASQPLEGALVLREPIVAGLSWLSLNRPQRRNALSIDLLRQLCDEIVRLASDPRERVVILRGIGPVFSAGLDLREAADSALAEASAQSLENTLALLRETDLIVISAVQGGAYAGGAGLMAACDLAVAADDALFGFPEARRGLLPALITSVLHPKVREGDLRDLFLVGDTIDARRAQQIGLLQRVVPAARLSQEAVAVGMRILQGGPDTIRRTKRLLREFSQGLSPASAERLKEIHLEARKSGEAEEGLAAFRERRDPHWTRKPGEGPGYE